MFHGWGLTTQFINAARNIQAVYVGGRFVNVLEDSKYRSSNQSAERWLENSDCLQLLFN